MSASEVPRYLTNVEIEQILSRVAPPQTPITEIREHIHREVKKMYKYQLEIMKLKPSKIEELGDFIANKTERSFFSPGAPVGFNISESVGQPMTQLGLKAIHSTGQSGKSAFKKFEQMIKIRPYKKNAADFMMKIHMYDKNISYESLYIRAQQFVTVAISDLLERNQIIRETYPFDDMSMYTDDFKKLNSYEDHGYAIRLRFDREKLFLHQIPLESIAMELSRIEGGSLFTVFYGPQIDGVIDIYPIPRAMCGEGEGDIEDGAKSGSGASSRTRSKSGLSKDAFRECCDIFENGLLRNRLQNIKLGEYNDISSAAIQKISVVDLILDVTRDFDSPEEESTTHARVWVNWVYAKKEGVPVEKLQHLLTLSGYPIEDQDPDGNYFVVESGDLDIKSKISKMLKDEDAALVKAFSETKRLTSTPLYTAGYYNIITTLGSNLAEVRSHPDVDEFSTISDSIMEIYEILGIEVARSYIEKSIFDLFTENGHHIAPRNISIMVDYMTSGIKPISVNPKNVYKADNSIIRAMCFEDPKANIVKGAVLSTEEPVSNVSARILFGAKQKLGTGAFEVIEDPEVMALYESLQSENEAGAFRLTSETLAKNRKQEQKVNPSIGVNNRPKPVLNNEPDYDVPIGSAIPQAASDLFSEDDDLSKGSEIDFML